MTVVQENIMDIESIQDVAERVAEDNVQASPELEAIYLFPSSGYHSSGAARPRDHPE